MLMGQKSPSMKRLISVCVISSQVRSIALENELNNNACRMNPTHCIPLSTREQLIYFLRSIIAGKPEFKENRIHILKTEEEMMDFFYDYLATSTAGINEALWASSPKVPISHSHNNCGYYRYDRYFHRSVLFSLC
jgi:hypothetical protein